MSVSANANCETNYWVSRGMLKLDHLVIYAIWAGGP
jgi:hypothetical protein